MKRNVFMRASGLALLLVLSVQAFAADGDKNHAAKANVDSKSGRWATAYPEYSAFSKSLKGLSETDGKFKLWKDESSQEWSYDKTKMGKAWSFMKDTGREYRIQLAAVCADSDKGAKWFGELMDYCLDKSLGAKISKADGGIAALDVATLSACDLEMKWYFGWKKKAGKSSAADEQFANGSEKFFGWFADKLMVSEENKPFNPEDFKRADAGGAVEGVTWVTKKSAQIRELVKSSDYNKENICQIGDLAKSGTGDTSGTGGDCKGGYGCAKATGGYEQKAATSYGNTPGGLPAAQAYPAAGYSNGAGFYDPGAQNYNKKDGYGNIAGLMSGLYNGNQNYQQQPYIPPAAPPGAAAPGIAAAAAPIFPAQGPIGYGGGGIGVGVAVRKYPRPYPPQPYPMPLPQPLPPGPVPMPYVEPVKKAKVKVTVKETSSAKPISNPTPVQLPVQAKPFQIPGRTGWWIMGPNGQPVPFNTTVQIPVAVYPNPVRPVTPVYPGYPTVPTTPVFPTVPPVTPVFPTILPTPGPTVGPVLPDPIRNRIPRTTSRAK